MVGHNHTPCSAGGEQDRQWWVTTVQCWWGTGQAVVGHNHTPVQCWWGAGQAVVGHNHTPVLVGSRTGSGGSQPYPSAGGEQDRQWWVTTIPQCWWGVGQAVVGHNCWWGDLEGQAGQAVVGHNHTPCSGS